jgi:histidinol phosphatase-like enzyme
MGQMDPDILKAHNAFIFKGQYVPEKMLKMKITHISEMSRSEYDVTWCHIPEEQNPQLHQWFKPKTSTFQEICSNFKSHLKKKKTVSTNT